MIKDSLLVFADALSGTLSAASSDYIDQGAKADAYVNCWVNVQIPTAFTATGAPTNTFQLQTADSSDFVSNAVTLAQSAALLAADLVANKFVWQIRIPAGAKRYLRVYKVTSSSVGNIFSAGTWSSFLSRDINLNTGKVLA